ncbi:hypothetical protein [Bacillus massiliigorillae]|uniref:hypothetical protein n=1 Tax=Bacillus massiliigorillae TaxID=1243664 RepID=UPI0003A1604B|nr:hypothetical protein [Bacillus massiliigorillae]
MALLNSILPIVILLIFALLFRYLVQYLRRNNNVFSKKLMWFLSGYLLLLIIATFISIFIPKHELTKHKEAFESKVAKEISQFKNDLLQGNLQQIDSNLIKSSYEFEWKENVLQIQEIQNQFLEMPIYIEEKERNDHLIEAMMYTSKHYYQDIDITDEIKPIEMELRDNTLFITLVRSEIKLSKMTAGFPIRQFTGESVFNDHNDSIGQSVIYIKVPKGVKIENEDNFNITYVEKLKKSD